MLVWNSHRIFVTLFHVLPSVTTYCIYHRDIHGPSPGGTLRSGPHHCPHAGHGTEALWKYLHRSTLQTILSLQPKVVAEAWLDTPLIWNPEKSPFAPFHLKRVHFRANSHFLECIFQTFHLFLQWLFLPTVELHICFDIFSFTNRCHRSILFALFFGLCFLSYYMCL